MQNIAIQVKDLQKSYKQLAVLKSIRALLSEQPVSHEIWVALTWCVGILVVAYIFAMRAYKKRVS